MDDEFSDQARCREMLDGLPGIENVCVFMADALRWDHLPDAVAERGLTVKTIAASLTTHTSLPSMLTGLWPKRHGVLSWQHQMPDVPNLLDLECIDAGYFMPGDDAENDGTFSVLRQDERRQLAALESPWSYFERHHGGHAPFAAADWDGSWEEFVSEFSGDREKHRRWYQKAVDGTVDDFEKRLQTIRKKGEMDETLVVFTSDHGEYLGESGLVDHTSPIRPEGVYVPTVFIHPDIPDAQAPGIMRHVDLLPTILDAMDRKILDHLDGQSLAGGFPEQGYAFATSNTYLRGRPRQIYEATSVWDADGGWVRNETHPLKRMVMASGLVAGSRWKATHLRRNMASYPAAARHYLQSRQQFGDPGFSFEEAIETINSVESRSPVTEQRTHEISAKTEERLNELGYL